MKRIHLPVQLQGLIRWDEDAGVYVSCCPALQLYSQGESEEEAEEAIKSAVHLFISTRLEKVFLERTLRGGSV